MALPIYTSSAFTGTTGVEVAANASVEVRSEADDSLVTLYSDRAGTVQINNPFQADAFGRFQFFAAPNADGWRITVTSGSDSHTLRFQQPMGYVGGLQESDNIEVTATGASAARTLADHLATLPDAKVAVAGGEPRSLAEHLATLPDTEISAKKIAATGSTTARSLADRFGEVFNVKDYGAIGDGTLHTLSEKYASLAEAQVDYPVATSLNESIDTMAIQAAINAAKSAGGGVVFVPVGTYIALKLNPTGQGTTTPDNMALHIDDSNIYLVGQGAGLSVIKNDPNAAERFITLGIGTIPISNGTVSIFRGGVIGLEFDGSYTPNPAELDDGNMVIWAYGIQDYVFRDLYVHDSSDYGIGLQNGGHVNVQLQNILIENTMADAIDVKNNGNNDRGCMMNNVTVRRFGRAGTASNPFAGIDLMGPRWELNNIHVELFGDAGNCDAGIRLKQGEGADSRGFGAHQAVLNNVYVKGESGGLLDVTGIDVKTREVHLSNAYIEDCPGTGVKIHQHEAVINNVRVTQSGIGFWTLGVSGENSNGDRALFTGCIARGCTTGFDLRGLEASLSSCIARSCDTGVRITGNNNRWFAGEIAANTTDVSNTGNANIILHAIGFGSSGV